MSKFTAQSAREIVAKESFSTRGYVIDQIKKAARNDQTSVSLPDLNLQKVDRAWFSAGGFVIKDTNISWRYFS